MIKEETNTKETMPTCRTNEELGDDSDANVAVVAHSAREAKKLAWNYQWHELDCEWTDLRVYWIREAQVEKLSVGVIDEDLALKCGLFGYID